MAFFLETSIQITRICGYHKNKKEINSAIQDNPLYTSNYVLMEFKRSLLNSFITFYSILKEEEEVAEAFQRYSMTYRPREAKRWFNITGWLIKEGCSIDEYNREELLRKLETMIEWQLIHEFKKDITFVEDNINCDIYHLEPQDQANNYQDFAQAFSCRRGIAKCLLPIFIERFDEFLMIIAKSSSEEKYMKEIKSLCQDIVREPTMIQGKINCSKLADLIIYLECPPEYLLLTFDRDYEQINDVLSSREVERLTFHRN